MTAIEKVQLYIGQLVCKVMELEAALEVEKAKNLPVEIMTEAELLKQAKRG